MSLTNNTSKIINTPSYVSSVSSGTLKPTASIAGTSLALSSLPNNANMIPTLMTNKFVILFIILIICVLVILTFLALFTPSLFTSTNNMTLTDEKIAANISIIVCFVIIIFGLLIYYLPALKDVKNFFIQLKMVIIIILYTIFLILLFRLMPVKTMDSHSYIITPLTMLATLVIFFMGFKTNYLKEFNVNYERIKTIVLFLCFLTILFVYYTCNTGGFVQYYFGPCLLITLLLAFFAFLYVIIIFGLPDKKSGNVPNNSSGSFFSYFRKFSVYGSIIFVIYLIVSIIGIMYLNGDFNKSQKNTNIPPTERTGYYKNMNMSDSSKSETLSAAQLDSLAFSPPSSKSNSQSGLFLDLSFLKVGGKEHKIEIPLLTSYVNNYNSGINTASDFLFDTNTSSYNPNQTNNYTEGFDNLHDVNDLSDTNLANLITSNSKTTPEQKGSLTLAIIFIIVTTLIFGTTLLLNIFPESIEYFKTNRVSNLDELSLFKRSLLILFGLVISGLIIIWIVYYIQSFSSQTGLVSFILNLMLVLIILILLFKTFNVTFISKKSNARKDAIFSLMINLILYIPCLLSGFIDSITAIASGKEYSTTTTSILLIIIVIILFIIYIKLPSLEEKISLQGGQLIVNRPVPIMNVSPLATYTELNGNNDNNYEYGLSFWFFIDAMAPNTNASYSKYTSIINYGNKPNVSYNPNENKIQVTMEKLDRSIVNTDISGNKTEFNDSYTEEVVYEKSGIMLQKWNNIIINYSGGTLDIFLNNDLMKSVNGIVPYMRNDPLTVGSENGLYGGVCNVVYFNKPLDANKMYYLYNNVKDKSPPIASNSTEEIIYNKSIISSSK